MAVNRKHNLLFQREKARWCVIQGVAGLRGDGCLSSADLHRAREKQTASFTLFCKDAAGDSMGRGGDDIQVAVVPKDKKDRFVLQSGVTGETR